MTLPWLKERLQAASQTDFKDSLGAACDEFFKCHNGCCCADPEPA
jgi:hypothetical protein